jgi:hypothetical protein
MGTRERATWAGRSGVWLVSVGLGLAGACGGESDDPPLNPTGAGAVGGSMLPTGSGGKAGGSSGGSAGKGGRGGTTGEGGDAGEMVTMPGGPVVEVTSPPALDDPDDGEVLVEDEITVTCEVRAAAGGQPVDPSTVSIQLLDADEAVVDEVTAAPTGEPDEFGARVILAKVTDNGAVGFRCTAADTSMPPLLGSDTLFSLVDHGPLIEVTSPVPESAHPLAGALRVRFSVNPSPVASGDAGAVVDDVTLEIAGVPIDAGTPDDGDYDVSVDLADTTVFADTPNGTVPVTITATNRRSPSARRVLSYGFVIDGEGPDIIITEPANEDVVGGQVALHFSVVDTLSGVDQASVVVELNLNEYRYGEGGTWSRMGDDYTFLFDSTQAEKDSVVQATINLRASDQVGNVANGESLVIYLDNVPPIVDLDPEFVREHKEGPDNFCSIAFDPVGPLPPDDGAAVGRLQRYRAVVWERTNVDPITDHIRYHSGTDVDSVFLYLQPDVDTPLLVNTDSDAACDDLLDTRDDLPFIHLRGIRPDGNSWFGSMADDPEVMPLGCEYENGTEPQRRCDPYDADMHRIIKFDFDAQVPVIFALGNLGMGPSCIGTDWETAPFAEGWACLAARAVDHAGNVGISTPLRICIDNGVAPPPDCTEPPPPCTDGCTVPPKFTSRILEL